ncbi:MAG: hypothetical protein DRN27_07680 [Thermoplasmata archaeon]|nr:MAG: hypothetical protein DRN27_07680 [Thermoplasmata archaeon]
MKTILFGSILAVFLMLIVATILFDLNGGSSNPNELFYGIENNADGTQTIIPLVDGTENRYVSGEVRVSVKKNETNGSFVSPLNMEPLINENGGKISYLNEYETVLSLTVQVPDGKEIEFIKDITKNDMIKSATLHTIGHIDK